MRILLGNLAVVLLAIPGLVSSALAAERIAVVERPTSLEIAVDGKPFATYVWKDPKILRPYFAHLHAQSGVQVTRNHPPVEGQDATDHAEMHPGLWLAFGDLNGKDFWRNNGRVEHVEFIERPKAQADRLTFAVRNRYVADGQTICAELSKIAIVAIGPRETLINWQSTFSGPNEFYFGDQEEMGLGIRLATPMTVKNGGHITNSDGLRDEKQVWGKPAAWCDYSGTVDGRAAGITIVPDPSNFRRSWFHARDYGVLVANPFGQKAFTKSEPSKVTVRKGESLTLGFLVLVHGGPLDAESLQKRLHELSPARSD